MSNKDNDISSLSHSKWRCHYHVVFAPKFRRQAIYGKIKTDIGKILRQLCEQKGIEIIEAELCPDHVHMLLAIPPKYSVAQIMGYLKGKSTQTRLRVARIRRQQKSAFRRRLRIEMRLAVYSARLKTLASKRPFQGKCIPLVQLVVMI